MAVPAAGLLCETLKKQLIVRKILRLLVSGKHEFLYRASFNQMFLDDPLEHLRRDGVIPDSFRIDDGDRSLFANAKTIRFRPVNAFIGSGESQFLEPALQIIP